MTKLSDLQSIVKNPTQDDLDIFDQWEREIKKNELYKTWLNHPITKKIANDICDRVKNLNQEILNTLGDNSEKINIRNNWEDFLRFFNPSIDTSSIIEEEIEQSIKSFKEYYEKK